MGPGANETVIDGVYNSITGTLPTWGTPERTAINAAVSALELPCYGIFILTGSV